MNSLEARELQTRRKDILAAALECFGEKGFQATKMLDIARKAGMSVGNLYNYFKNKDEIIEKFASQELERLVEKLKDPIGDKETERDSLKRFIKVRLDVRHARIVMEVMSETVRTERMAQIVRQFDHQWRKALLVAYERGGLNPEESRYRIERDMCVLDGLSLRILAHPTLDKDKLVDQICDIIMNS